MGGTGTRGKKNKYFMSEAYNISGKSLFRDKRKENRSYMKIKAKNVLRMMWSAAAMMLMVALVPMAQSCDLGDGDGYCYLPNPPGKLVPNAIVTVKTAADNTVYLQLDDNTTLLPLNLKGHPFKGKEVRALVNFRQKNADATPYTKAVWVNGIDSVLTKPAVATLGEKNDEVYGKDPIEVVNSFPTVCEDNYLTLYVGTVWGRSETRHLVNLVTGVNPDDPYEVELRQNAFGDTKGQMAYTTVAFSLKSLPKTGGKKVKLRVKYQSFNGEKTCEFD